VISNNSHTIEEALAKLQNFCGYQERCIKEVGQKLRDMGIDPGNSDTIIGRLQKDNYLNEERFAKSFVRGKFRVKKWGRNRLKAELKQRAIAINHITHALAQFSDDDYINAFNELAEKKCLSLRENDKNKKRKKLVDYLLYRGWESNMVYEKTWELIP